MACSCSLQSEIRHASLQHQRSTYRTEDLVQFIFAKFFFRFRISSYSCYKFFHCRLWCNNHQPGLSCFLGGLVRGLYLTNRFFGNSDLCIELLVKLVDYIPKELERVGSRFTEKVEVALICCKRGINLPPFCTCLDFTRSDELLEESLVHRASVCTISDVLITIP